MKRRKCLDHFLQTDCSNSVPNNGMLRSLGKYSVPAIIAGRNCDIEFDIIDSDIPLLLSKKAMKEIKMRIDLEKDIACVGGNCRLKNY